VKLVILDRDGVVNVDSDEFVKSADEWIPIEGSIKAISRLSKAGFTVVIATNQSGLGRGLFTVDALESMHQKMLQLVEEEGGEIAGIFYCPHHPDDGCYCRKPKAGLLDQIENALTTSTKDAFIIGDSLRDLQAGLEKGCRPVLVKTGKGLKTMALLTNQPDEALKDLPIHTNLSEAVDHIIDNSLS